MRRSPRERLIYLIAILVAAVPFAFGLIRALQTGTDFRYLWVAIASFIAATGVIAAWNARIRTPLSLASVVLIIATLVAAAMAFLLGARSAPAVLVVALAFGLCSAASSALYTLSRPRTI
jgi:predicted neutral ceramidase superfamily lipid hydrolase